MGIKNYLFRFLYLVAGFITLLLVTTTHTYASSGIISANPATGNFSRGETFNASVKVDGGGTLFNAAKAYVSVSPNLSVQSLVLGDCNFAFVTTPSNETLSFAGVILGDSSLSCTVYTLKLKAESGGEAYILVSDGSIKAYQGAAEILSAAHGSSFSISGTSGNNLIPSPTQPPLSLTDVALYTLTYTIPVVGNISSATTRITLDPSGPNPMVVTPTQLPDDKLVLVATFENVPAGVHTISIFNNEKEVSKQVINIAGQNRNIALGAVISKPFGIGDALAYIIIAVILVILITGGVFFYMVYFKRKHPGF
jgi:hypothetical protein